MRGRGWVGWLAAAVALAAALVIGYRVLAPAEVSTPARGSLPGLVSSRLGMIGTFSSAPLVVDGRVRVYADVRQIRADAPVDQRTQWSPYWSYRRWPAQLVGVVAAGGTVVSQWSDGKLVGLSADRGLVRWRAPGPALPEASYAGRRTGAATVYTPPHLYTAGSVVVSAGPGEARGYDAASGRELWRAGLPACPGRVDFTSGGRFAWACGGALAALDAATGRRLADWTGPGAVLPLGCTLGRSGCAGLRAGSRGYLWTGDAPTPAPALDPDGTRLVPPARTGRSLPVAVSADLTARAADTGRRLWRFAAPGARVLAVEAGFVHLLTAAFRLVTLDAATGKVRSRFVATAYREPITWAPGVAAAMDGYVTVERLHPSARPDDPNSAYYFKARPVLLARTL